VVPEIHQNLVETSSMVGRMSGTLGGTLGGGSSQPLGGGSTRGTGLVLPSRMEKRPRAVPWVEAPLVLGWRLHSCLGGGST
jgi:hypothetical protein